VYQLNLVNTLNGDFANGCAREYSTADCIMSDACDNR
jgi:hypothetical protein